MPFIHPPYIHSIKFIFLNVSTMHKHSRNEDDINQFSSVAQWCPTLCNTMNCSMWGFPVLHYLHEFAQTYVHWVTDAIWPSHPLSPPSSLSLNLSQHQGLFQRVSSSHLFFSSVQFCRSVVSDSLQVLISLSMLFQLCYWDCKKVSVPQIGEEEQWQSYLEKLLRRQWIISTMANMFLKSYSV